MIPKSIIPWSRLMPATKNLSPLTLHDSQKRKKTKKNELTPMMMGTSHPQIQNYNRSKDILTRSLDISVSPCMRSTPAKDSSCGNPEQ